MAPLGFRFVNTLIKIYICMYIGSVSIWKTSWKTSNDQTNRGGKSKSSACLVTRDSKTDIIWEMQHGPLKEDVILYREETLNEMKWPRPFWKCIKLPSSGIWVVQPRDTAGLETGRQLSILRREICEWNAA